MCSYVLYKTFIPTIIYLVLPLEASGGLKQVPTASFFEFWDVPRVI